MQEELFSEKCLIMLYVSTNFQENKQDSIQVIEQRRFSLETLQRDIIPQKL